MAENTPKGYSLSSITSNLTGMVDLPSGARVVVAMSGGVDSSVTAAILSNAGFDVIGITLQLYDHGEATQRKGSCCAGQDIHDAKNVSDKLGIAHYVLDYESRFQSAVIDDFADSYLRGETPIPCVRCNQTVKFTDLMAIARDLGAVALATGHYVQRIIGTRGPELHRALDRIKDQSYFLFATTESQLDFLRFPLGGLKKSDTRVIAASLGLDIGDKPDSQDICFVPNGSYARVIEMLRPERVEPGEIVDVNGTFVGRHKGIIHYTIGQRRGLGVGGCDEPLFVVRLEPKTRRVVVGPREMLGCRGVRLTEVNYLGVDQPTKQGLHVKVKIRSMMDPIPAFFLLRADGVAEVVFDQPQLGISSGQACVLYHGERLLGGGWIKESYSTLISGEAVMQKSPHKSC